MTLQLENRLLKRKQFRNLRELKLSGPLIDFASNDYLGLARSSKLLAAVFKEWGKHLNHFNGLGSTGSRLLTGNSRYVQDLEDSIAQFHGYEAGLLFNCGYMANLGLLSAIGTEESLIFFDIGVHASTHDGIKLCKAKAYPFKHNDLNHLEDRLKYNCFRGDRFICIESIYSTDGSMAPLAEICRLAHAYQAHLIVDEAHAIGVFGPNGKGLVAEQQLTSQVFAQINTFGKALGTYGAIVLGSNLLKKTLINFATSYVYTTALPFLTLAAIKCSYDLFPKMEKERQHLQNLIQLFKTFSHFSPTHIQSFPVNGNEAVKKMAQGLLDQGFNVSPLMSPTVQRGHEMLRICLHAFNTEHELLLLLKHIQESRSF